MSLSETIRRANEAAAGQILSSTPVDARVGAVLASYASPIRPTAAERREIERHPGVPCADRRSVVADTHPITASPLVDTLIGRGC